MKKKYLVPKSETLKALLREMCDDSPMTLPSSSGGEASPLGAPRVGAPAAGHSL